MQKPLGESGENVDRWVVMEYYRGIPAGLTVLHGDSDLPQPGKEFAGRVALVE